MGSSKTSIPLFLAILTTGRKSLSLAMRTIWFTRQGLWHKLGETMALLVAELCDIAIKVILNTAAAPLLGPFEYNYYFTLNVAIWYIFTEVGSIIENAAKMGAKIPPWLGKGIALLKGRVDEAAPIGKHEKQE
ncbi:MAG: phage holin family protein [Oscillospiraceae bacterium]|nr:phage holin family protein [Oscillospiraceae bacterium]